MLPYASPQPLSHEPLRALLPRFSLMSCSAAYATMLRRRHAYIFHYAILLIRHAYYRLMLLMSRDDA